MKVEMVVNTGVLLRVKSAEFEAIIRCEYTAKQSKGTDGITTHNPFYKWNKWYQQQKSLIK